jgi:hypothetical protein
MGKSNRQIGENMDKAPNNDKYDSVDGSTSSPSIDNSDSQLTSAMLSQLKDSGTSDFQFRQKNEVHKDSTESTPKR